MGTSWERKCKFVSTNLWTVIQAKKKKAIELHLVSEYYWLSVAIWFQDFQPQRFDDGLLEVIGLNAGSLVGKP